MDFSAAGGRWDYAAEHFEQRLARIAVGAAQTDKCTVGDLQIHVLEEVSPIRRLLAVAERHNVSYNLAQIVATIPGPVATHAHECLAAQF